MSAGHVILSPFSPELLEKPVSQVDTSRCGGDEAVAFIMKIHDGSVSSKKAVDANLTEP